MADKHFVNQDLGIEDVVLSFGDLLMGVGDEVCLFITLQLQAHQMGKL